MLPRRSHVGSIAQVGAWYDDSYTPLTLRSSAPCTPQGQAIGNDEIRSSFPQAQTHLPLESHGSPLEFSAQLYPGQSEIATNE